MQHRRPDCTDPVSIRACRFHVDDLSSAHVYLRLPEGKTIDDIPEDTLEDCCQLVKQNSIQGVPPPSPPGGGVLCALQPHSNPATHALFCAQAAN